MAVMNLNEFETELVKRGYFIERKSQTLNYRIWKRWIRRKMRLI
jgi:hypothetical protein